jgi:hypothetical protein
MADNSASSEITLIVKSQDGAEMQFKGAISGGGDNATTFLLKKKSAGRSPFPPAPAPPLKTNSFL